MDTVSLTIDGRAITVEKGKTVLQAAIEHGIQVPYYCYHPGLGVDGSCRVCIVKVEKMPKLQTACSTVCTDGMVVDTRGSDVVEARASVFEFLLINHPLDCPVCDKGGECPLQDFSYTFGPEYSRMEFPRRVFDGEGVRADVDFGPTIMLNRNRCILCTRCIRFMRDIDGDAQIGLVDRGYGSEIATFQERGVHSLISGNLMDVCPVGALTTRDYRFKARPWDNPQAVDTICTLCSKGCNTTLWLKAKPEWARGAQLIRITPRFNPDVNSYWMCDIGRFNYHWIEGEDRVKRPLVRDATGLLSPTPWHDAIAKATERLTAAGRGNVFQGRGPTPASQTLRFLVSAHASHEELFLIRRLTDTLAGEEGRGLINVTWRTSPKVQPADTSFPVPPVDAPNLAGARDLGFDVPAGDAPVADLSPLRQAIDGGQIAAVYVFDPGPHGSLGDVTWLIEARRAGRFQTLIVQGVLLTDLAREADVVLPGAAFVEKDATYTNDKGRVQSAARGMAPPGDAMEDWQIFVNLGLALGVPLAYTSAAHVRADIAAAMSGRPGYAELGNVAFARPVPARHWLQASNPSERWKWDFMFQDLPPVKFADEASVATSRPETVIPLRQVE
jgi:NADH-quinone oxidoreductase subunit G